MPDVNCSIMAIASLISLNQRCRGKLKDKDRLAFGSFRYLRPKHLPIGQIGPNAKNITAYGLNGSSFTGGHVIAGDLNGGGPEISITTLHGDVMLRKL